MTQRSLPAGEPCILQQNIINIYTPNIAVITIREADFSPRHLEWLFDAKRSSSPCVGITGAYTHSEHTLTALALAVNSVEVGKELANVLVIELSSDRSDKIMSIRANFQRVVLCRPYCHLLGFDLAPLSLLLHMLYGVHINSGIDIQSALPITSRMPIASIRFALGDDSELVAENISAVFKEQEYDPKHLQYLAQRAWVSAYMGNMEVMQGCYNTDAPKINTEKLNNRHLQLLEKLASDKHLLAAMDPSTVSHTFSSTEWDSKKQKLKVVNSKFSNRMYRDSIPTISVKTADGTFTESVDSSDVSGKTATMKFNNLSLGGKEVTSIISHSRSTPTYAEAKLKEDILLILQGKKSIDSPWINLIWDLPGPILWPEEVVLSEPIPLAVNPQYPINPSQISAIESMLSPALEDKLTIIQGPPGTGKTSVIATYVLSAIAAGQRGIWLMAQSNVAVKNIAEKLMDIGFEDWTLLISVDFHFEWHEHLYKQLPQNHILRSDQFPKSPAAVERSLRSSSVILCTLSMISNPRLQELGFIKVIPPISIVIDEASQITIDDYFPMLNAFSDIIQKMSLIGDQKQLPPYGQESIGNLESIFEMPHLSSKVKFLNTQYRMPPQIGDFVSAEVYDKQLNSNPRHPVSRSTLSCVFIDVADGSESKDGTSWVNLKQADAIIELATYIEEKELSFRIITPYDGQRNKIETELRKSGLNADNKCFNVDSFQGNEDDYIIISVVRSKELGFLSNLRRTNVMLTRCKRGMFIFTNKKFLEGKGKDCLVGKMVAAWGSEAWKDGEGVKKMVDEKV